MKNFPVSVSVWCGPVAQLLFCRLHLGLMVLLLAAPLLACSPAGLNGLRSQVSIEAGKQFELGGRQLLGFRVAAHNVGPVAVEIKERAADGRVMSVGLLQPGQQTKAVFGMGSQAILVNLGARQAKIDVDITNGSGLGMGYAAAQPTGASLSAPSPEAAPGAASAGVATPKLSRLLIPAGQEFLLGGGQAGGFTFVGTNVGTVAVQAQERTSDGQTLARGVIAPGQAVELQFGPGSQALLYNGSGTQARLKTDVSRLNPRELGMTYRKGNK
jgi:hypothetical protein